jgi:hypothetical protein
VPARIHLFANYLFVWIFLDNHRTMSNKDERAIPGYTGKLNTTKPEQPYDDYKRDASAISQALRSSVFGPTIDLPAEESSTKAAMRVGRKNTISIHYT